MTCIDDENSEDSNKDDDEDEEDTPLAELWCWDSDVSSGDYVS